VVVQQVPTRKYPEGLAAHLFGYVGEIRESQLNSEEFAAVEAGAIIGQAGLEKVYNAHLMGTDGSRYVIINSVGRELDELLEEQPIDGERLQLTIDLDLQRALEDGFAAAGFNGAAAFLDPQTGQVLAMTSLPAYDPNVFASGLDNASLSKLLNDPRKPFINRLIQGTYSPGSTFKIVMAVAGLEERVITPESRVFCPGYGTFYGRPFRCHKAGGHGWMDVRHAIEQSCNVFFYGRLQPRSPARFADLFARQRRWRAGAHERSAYRATVPRRDAGQIHTRQTWQERRERSRAARIARPQGAAASGELSSQLPTLLAQQDTHHFPRDGSVVHQD
jgi:penicillin-binding protein 2